MQGGRGFDEEFAGWEEGGVAEEDGWRRRGRGGGVVRGSVVAVVALRAGEGPFVGVVGAAELAGEETVGGIGGWGRADGGRGGEGCGGEVGEGGDGGVGKRVAGVIDQGGRIGSGSGGAFIVEDCEAAKELTQAAVGYAECVLADGLVELDEEGDAVTWVDNNEVNGLRDNVVSIYGVYV